jgi:hypothetical protein
MSRVIDRTIANHDSDHELEDGYNGLESSSFAYIQYHLMPVIEGVVNELRSDTQHSSMLNARWRDLNVDRLICDCVFHHL